MLDAERFEVLGFKLADAVYGHVVEQARGGGKDHGHLLLDRDRAELGLLQDLDERLTTAKLALRGGVEVGAKLGEGFELAELRQVEAERTRDLSSWP